MDRGADEAVLSTDRGARRRAAGRLMDGDDSWLAIRFADPNRAATRTAFGRNGLAPAIRLADPAAIRLADPSAIRFAAPCGSHRPAPYIQHDHATVIHRLGDAKSRLSSRL